MDKLITFSEAINDAVRIAMKNDHNVILMGEDVAGKSDRSHVVL